MNFGFVKELKNKSPEPNKDRTGGQILDATLLVFDNDYYIRVLAGKGVFGSDQTLLGDHRTKWIVHC